MFLLLSFLVFFFFFFQAEDGIRDPLVTGVQTCALPIWDFTTDSGSAPLARVSNRAQSRCKAEVEEPWGARKKFLSWFPTVSFRRFSARSEERRVGKECRSRWARYH